MKQQTFTDMEYSHRRRKTRRERFLDQMDELIPWDHWVSEIRPYYPAGRRGRPPRGIETMLRMYLLQIWFSLSDEGIEDAIYDSYSMRDFMRIDFINDQAPSATTLRRFRHLIRENKIEEQILEDLDKRLDERGLTVHKGSFVNARLTGGR